MTQKNWVIREPEKADIIRLSKELNIFPLTARLLLNRGISSGEDALAFLKKETGAFHDPFLLPDMEKAVRTVIDALNHNRRITVYGDYDVDGITATCVLYRYLKSRGADVHYYIPDRFGEGYGLNRSALETLKNDGTQLVVTVDTGTTAIEEAQYARENGMTLVVTDHHQCREELPDCAAVVNPRRSDSAYPYAELAGVGVAFKLICALEEGYSSNEKEKIELTRRLCLDYAELVAIGTVADVMPLTDENRLIVSLGLELLRETKQIGIKALMDAATAQPEGMKSKYPPKKKKMTASFIGFTLAPRLNAAGRLASAKRAVSLFLTTDETEAADIAAALCEMNRERQETENEIAAAAYAEVETQHDLENEKVLVLAGAGWHNGVIGIVASRVTERYHLPSILISFADEKEETGKGSGRSVKGLHLADALSACDDLLEKHGGHEMAAGLTIKRENLDAFRARINDYAKRVLDGGTYENNVYADGETTLSDLVLPVAQECALLEPYGMGNPTPQFIVRDVLVRDLTPVGNGKHARLTLTKGDTNVTAMYFGVDADALPFRPGCAVDVLFQMDINDFMNRLSVQMIVSDIRFSEATLEAVEAEKVLYQKMLNGEALSQQHLLPTRGECGGCYRYLKSRAEGYTYRSYDTVCLSKRLDLPYYRLMCALRIMEERGLISIEPTVGDEMNITVLPVDGKTDLEQSPLLLQYRSIYE